MLIFFVCACVCVCLCVSLAKYTCPLSGCERHYGDLAGLARHMRCGHTIFDMRRLGLPNPSGIQWAGEARYDTPHLLWARDLDNDWHLPLLCGSHSMTGWCRPSFPLHVPISPFVAIPNTADGLASVVLLAMRPRPSRWVDRWYDMNQYSGSDTHQLLMFFGG